MSEASGVPLKVNAQSIDHSKVLECYTTLSGPRLAALFDQLYSPETTFSDPIVIATPRHEARLQFLSLQHFFDSITAEANSTTSSGDETRMDVHFEYVWARNSWFSRKALPEVTHIDAVITLNQDPATGKIVSHVEEWRSPAVRVLPTLVRKANAKSMNAVFRLLGWEKELKQRNSDGTGFGTAAATVKEE